MPPLKNFLCFLHRLAAAGNDVVGVVYQVPTTESWRCVWYKGRREGEGGQKKRWLRREEVKSRPSSTLFPRYRGCLFAVGALPPIQYDILFWRSSDVMLSISVSSPQRWERNECEYRFFDDSLILRGWPAARRNLTLSL